MTTHKPIRVELWERMIVTCGCDHKHIMEQAGTIACECGAIITLRVLSEARYEITAEYPMEMIEHMTKRIQIKTEVNE